MSHYQLSYVAELLN